MKAEKPKRPQGNNNQQQGEQAAKEGFKTRNYSEQEKLETMILLKKNKGNVSKTARQTGVNPATIQRWLKSPVGEGVHKMLDDLRNPKSADITSLARKKSEGKLLTLKILTEARDHIVLETDYQRALNVAKLKALDKVVSLVEDSKSLRDTTEALKVLHEMGFTQKDVSDRMSEKMGFFELARMHYSSVRKQVNYKHGDVEDVEATFLDKNNKTLPN